MAAGSRAWLIGTRPCSRPPRWTEGHSSPLAEWKVATSTESMDSSTAAKACDRTEATNPGPVPAGSKARNSLAILLSSAKAVARPVSSPVAPASSARSGVGPSSSCPPAATLRSPRWSASGPLARLRVCNWAFTSARSSRPLPLRVRTGMPAERRAWSTGSVWALVRTSTAWSRQRPFGPRRSRTFRAMASASAVWSA